MAGERINASDVGATLTALPLLCAALLAACSPPSPRQPDAVHVTTATDTPQPAITALPRERLPVAAAAPAPAPDPSPTATPPPRRAFVDPPLPPELRN
jgi:hypothetical protein